MENFNGRRAEDQEQNRRKARSAGIKLLIGGLLSRHFMRPLTELTHAITAMQRGQLAQQVRVRTNDE